MSRLGSLYIKLGEPDGEMSGCCETADWAAGYIEELQTELNEQARLLGMSAERELALLAEIERLRAVFDAASAVLRYDGADVAKCAVAMLAMDKAVQVVKDQGGEW